MPSPLCPLFQANRLTRRFARSGNERADGSTALRPGLPGAAPAAPLRGASGGSEPGGAGGAARERPKQVPRTSPSHERMVEMVSLGLLCSASLLN